MAIKLIANYSKRLGLPGYSSHQFSVSVETEVLNVEDVQAESSQLYALLQGSVDHEIKSTGFVPPATYGLTSNTGQQTQENGNGHWACSEKQRDLLLKVIEQQHLDKLIVDSLAHERFGKRVKQLSKLEMSGLLDELLESANGSGNRTQANGNGRRATYARTGGRR